MQIYIQFILGFLIYSCAAAIMYIPAIKETKYYYFIGILFAIIANYTWLDITTKLSQQRDILFYGLLWDIMLTSAYLIIPIIFFDVKLTLLQGLGILLIISGLIITKL